MSGTKEKRIKSSTLLIGLCWLIYTCSYIGKLSYTANITQIEKTFFVTHSQAGLVGTFFFFAYGIGQVVNGIFCRKYNVRWVIFGALIVSAIANLCVALTDNFAVIKYLWLINGGALSVLWPTLMRLLSETVHKKDMPKTVVAMGTTVATGTFLVYGLSSFFALFDLFRIVFWIAGLLIPGVALVWFFFLPKLTKACEKEYAAEESAEEALAGKTERKGRLGGYVAFSLCVMALFAVADNLIKDGLTTWVPSILKETYGFPDSLSILLTLVLPLFAIFGTAVAVWLKKRISDFLTLCALFFGASGGLIGCVIGFMDVSSVIMLVCFALVSCFTSSINNVITSMVPLYMKDKVNSGLLAGVLNGCCYIGSTISSYGLGSVAKAGGWNAVFWLLFALTVGASVLGFAVALFAKLFSKKKGAGTR